MFRNLPSSLSTLVLFLSNPFWALAIDAIHFTNPDWTGIAAGTPFEVAWLGGDTSQPAKLVLVKGPAENLQTVETLTEASHSPYFWTPEQSLEAGTYALSITQLGVTNYSPRFQVTNANNPAGAGAGAGPASSAPSPPSPTAIGAGAGAGAGTGTGTDTTPLSEIIYSEAPEATSYPIAIAAAPIYTAASYISASASLSLSAPPKTTITSTPTISPSSTYSYSYPNPSYPYGSAGLGTGTGNKAGNGSAQGVATGIAHASEYKVLDFTGGAAATVTGRGTWAVGFAVLVAVGVGVGGGGGGGW